MQCRGRAAWLAASGELTALHTRHSTHQGDLAIKTKVEGDGSVPRVNAGLTCRLAVGSVLVGELPLELRLRRDEVKQDVRVY